MPSDYMFQQSAALAAAGVINPIGAQKVERPQGRGFVSIGLNGSAAGLIASIDVAGANVVDNWQVNALNRLPLLPDDIFLRDVPYPAPMSQNRVSITNPTAGALTWFLLVRWGIMPWHQR